MIVSIIVPCYNHAAYLEERIESILNQSYKNFEIVILDDCSTDHTAEILSKYEQHPKVSHCLLNKQNSGSTFHQWNKGIALAKGELIWIAESDDVADEKFLEIMVQQFQRNSNLNLAYSQSHRMNAKGEITGSWKTHTDHLDAQQFEQSFTMLGLEFVKRYFQEKNIIPNASAVIFKKSIFNDVGAANPELKYIGDWDVWYRILSKGELYFHHQCLNYFRYHDTSVIAKAFKDNERPIELEMQVTLFFKNLLIFFKDDPVLNRQLKRSLKYAIKNTLKLAIQQPRLNHQHLLFVAQQYIHFSFKLRFI